MDRLIVDASFKHRGGLADEGLQTGKRHLLRIDYLKLLRRGANKFDKTRGCSDFSDSLICFTLTGACNTPLVPSESSWRECQW